MTRADLDLVNGAIRVKAEISKNDRGCWKPIPPDMASYFQTLPKETEYLFYRAVEEKKTGKVQYFGLGSFHSAWYRCLKLAGLTGLHFHDTRHMAATSLIDNGTLENKYAAELLPPGAEKSPGAGAIFAQPWTLLGHSEEASSVRKTGKSDKSTVNRPL